MTAIEKIDAEIARLQARIDGLEAAKELIAGDPDPAPKAPPPAARPAGGLREERRRALANKLRADGPQTFTAIVSSSGMDRGQVQRLLRDDPWFEKADPANRMSPWRLTPAGAAAVRAN